MRFFRHIPVNLEPLSEVYIEGKRHYKTPEGNIYPSVTTVLSSEKNDSLEAWKKRVGAEEAEKIARIAADKGEDLHTICENYLRNIEKPSKGMMPSIQALFKDIRPLVDRIDDLMCVEGQLYSNRIGVAGRCDIIGKFDGVLSVIDFKTSRMETKLEDDKIQKYFKQLWAYGTMFHEKTGIQIPQGVLIVASQDHLPQLHIQMLHKYENGFMQILRNYKEQNRV